MIERLTPTGSPQALGPYSHVVRAGDFLYMSGQTPIDPATGAISTGDIGEQTRIVMTNMKNMLEGVGSSFADVVKCNVYLKNGADFKGMNAVYGEFVSGNKPARTTVVTGFAVDILVEIDCIAYSPKK